MLRRGPFLLPEQGGAYRSGAISHSFCVPTPQLRGPDFFFKGKGGFWNHSPVSAVSPLDRTLRHLLHDGFGVCPQWKDEAGVGSLPCPVRPGVLYRASRK